MRSGRVARGALNLVVLLLSLSVFLGIGELIARAIYPEFADQFHSRQLTAGKRIHRGEVFGLKTRLPAANAKIEPSAGTPVTIVVGDSVAIGYGLSYYDTFWAVWQRYFQIQGKPDRVIALSGYGNNFMDNIDSIVHAVNVFRDHGLQVDRVVYQFNYNDLLPSTQADLQEWGKRKSVWEWLRQDFWIATLRHRLLNYSVFLRVLSIKGAALFRTDSTSCADLGRSAMGGYSHAFVAKGMEEEGERSWQAFEKNVETLVDNLNGVPFAILISPISPFVHPELPEHHVALPTRMDCATVDPPQRLHALSRRLGFPICDPAPYLSDAFRHYRDEGNPKVLFHENDENHPNEMGSLLIGEYCYQRLFVQGQERE